VQSAVLAAIVTSTASIVVAVTSAGLTYVSQRRNQREKAEQDTKLETLKTELANLNAERNALR
jgi:hypothetical protein